MEKEHAETVERTLWSNIVALEEEAEMLEQFSVDLGPESREKAQKRREQATALRAMLKE
jgi:hypothetical protein